MSFIDTFSIKTEACVTVAARKVAGASPDEVDFFNWPNPSSRTMVDSASNRNEYQEFSWVKGRPARKADNPTAICEPIV
jgi:hypothetical protein